MQQNDVPVVKMARIVESRMETCLDLATLAGRCHRLPQPWPGGWQSVPKVTESVVINPCSSAGGMEGLFHILKSLALARTGKIPTLISSPEIINEPAAILRLVFRRRIAHTWPLKETEETEGIRAREQDQSRYAWRHERPAHAREHDLFENIRAWETDRHPLSPP